MSARKTYAIAGAAAAALGLLTGVGYRRFRQELRAAQLRVSSGSSLADTGAQATAVEARHQERM